MKRIYLFELAKSPYCLFTIVLSFILSYFLTPGTIGLSALQVCGIGAPVCSAAVGMGLLSSIMPQIFMIALTKFSLYIIPLSIILQLFSLYFMNCFKESHE